MVVMQEILGWVAVALLFIASLGQIALIGKPRHVLRIPEVIFSVFLNMVVALFVVLVILQ